MYEASFPPQHLNTPFVGLKHLYVDKKQDQIK